MSVTSLKKLDDTTYVFSADYNIMFSYMYALEDDKKASILQEKKEMKDYEILDEIPFYGNGAGFTNKKRNSLFIYHSDTKKIIRVSSELFQVNDYELSEDKKTIYYAGEAFSTHLTNKESIMAYEIKSEKTHTLVESKELSIYKILPYNGALLVIANMQSNYGLNENPNFYLLNLETKEWKLGFSFNP